MDIQNSVLIQYATLDDIEHMVNRAVDARMKAFYDAVREKPPSLVRRKAAAKMLGVSLPTIDNYGRHGILNPKHIGGRVFYSLDEISSLSRKYNAGE